MKDSNKNKSRKSSSKKASKGGDFSQIAVNDQFAHIEAVRAQPLEVKIYNNNFDKALKAFRALVQKERVLSTFKERQTYEKPSDKRRRKRNEMKRKRLEVSNQSSKRSKRSSSRPQKRDSAQE